MDEKGAIELSRIKQHQTEIIDDFPHSKKIDLKLHKSLPLDSIYRWTWQLIVQRLKLVTIYSLYKLDSLEILLEIFCDFTRRDLTEEWRFFTLKLFKLWIRSTLRWLWKFE